MAMLPSTLIATQHHPLRAKINKTRISLPENSAVGRHSAVFSDPPRGFRFTQAISISFYRCGRQAFTENVKANGRQSYQARISDWKRKIWAVSPDASPEIEEARWVREEQRWLREEQRWLREEARWAQERQDFDRERNAWKEIIKELKNEITELRNGAKDERITDKSLISLVAGLKTVLQSLATSHVEDTRFVDGSEGRDVRQISTVTSFSGRTADTFMLEQNPDAALNTVDFVLPAEAFDTSTTLRPSTTNSASQIFVTAAGSKVDGANKSSSSKWRTLKKGSEGGDVQQLQEALASLGFYSGDEELESSVFSTGTEKAVKAWQATYEIPEDGVVSADLLARLFEERLSSTGRSSQTGYKSSLMEESSTLLSESTSMAKNEEEKVAAQLLERLIGGALKPDGGSKTVEHKSTAKAVAHSAKSSAEAHVGKKSAVREIDGYSQTHSSEGMWSQKRVYLLGENRWEEPERLLRNKNGSSSTSQKEDQKCFSCRGEGFTLCTECEGTGELNVEEQFLEWTEEGAKCPYCSGEGAVPCDVCNSQSSWDKV